jgi:hypothetical protein
VLDAHRKFKIAKNKTKNRVEIFIKISFEVINLKITALDFADISICILQDSVPINKFDRIRRKLGKNLLKGLLLMIISHVGSMKRKIIKLNKIIILKISF